MLRRRFPVRRGRFAVRRPKVSSPIPGGDGAPTSPPGEIPGASREAFREVSGAPRASSSAAPNRSRAPASATVHPPTRVRRSRMKPAPARGGCRVLLVIRPSHPIHRRVGYAGLPAASRTRPSGPRGAARQTSHAARQWADPGTSPHRSEGLRCGRAARGRIGWGTRGASQACGAAAARQTSPGAPDTSSCAPPPSPTGSQTFPDAPETSRTAFDRAPGPRGCWPPVRARRALSDGGSNE